MHQTTCTNISKLRGDKNIFSGILVPGIVLLQNSKIYSRVIAFQLPSIEMGFAVILDPMNDKSYSVLVYVTELLLNDWTDFNEICVALGGFENGLPLQFGPI